jgi:uncharacterized protein YggU (UPF0235/DUF167 family)
VARVRVKVIPRSSRSELIPDGENYKAYLHSAPTGGQANDELISLVADYFGIPKSSISIARGVKSRIKEIDY